MLFNTEKYASEIIFNLLILEKSCFRQYIWKELQRIIDKIMNNV